MGQAKGERWQVLDLIIDPDARSVTRGGKAIALPNLSFRFLLELVEAAPRVLSSGELMESVWDGVFVNSETVTQRAKLLRDALGDDHHSPRYFSVRRGIGYQLIPDAVRLGSAAPPAVPAPRRRRKAVLAALAAGFGLIVLPGSVALYRQVAALGQTAPVRVAVLPFDNLSADPADAYIAQGISEMVLNRLSTTPGLSVIGRESALLSKVSALPPQTAGRKLEADFVVKGSVQKFGSMLRVTSFVLDTHKGTRLWSQGFDWPLDRLYALQDRIAEQAARSLAAREPEGGRQTGTPAPGPNPDAYLAFLKGKALLGRMRVADTEAAAAQFQRSVDLDPAYAPAKVALFDARMQAASLRSEDLEPVRARFQPLLDKALEIDPDSGAALFARAMWSNLPRDERLALFERAAVKDPSNSRGLVAYAQLIEWGRRDGDPTGKSQKLMDRVMALDPLSPDAQFWSIQRNVVLFRSPAEIEQEQRRALELDPDNVLLANRFAMRSWRMNGNTAEGIQRMERIIATDPQYARNAHVAAAMYLDVGEPAAARAVAASTPATRDSARAVLALYNRDWRGAGEAALGPRGFLFNQFENWLWPEAVRDYAIRSGQVDRGAQAIATRFGFDPAEPRVTTLQQTAAAPPLAQLLMAGGRNAAAMRLLAEVVQWVDQHPQMGFQGGLGRSKASALMLLGQKDQALSVLLAATGRAHDIRHCWYLTAQDPIWAPVRADPRFAQVARICADSIRTQRGLVDAARRAGKLPVRVG